LWNTQLEGVDRNGERFAYIFFSAGGMGARYNDDGLSATAFPSGIKGVPAEAIESVSPVIMHQRSLILDSGGPGTFRGGLGQEITLSIDSDAPALHSCMYDRTRCAPRGFLDGEEGLRGELFLSNGTVLPPKGRYDLQADQTVTLRIPGGGGYGSPLDRDPEKVLEDVKQQRVSAGAARERYGVVIDSENWRVDGEATEVLRSEMRLKNSKR